jgi:hypothetical protein
MSRPFLSLKLQAPFLIWLAATFCGTAPTFARIKIGSYPFPFVFSRRERWIGQFTLC